MDVEVAVTDQSGQPLAIFRRGHAPEYAGEGEAERLGTALAGRRLPRNGLPSLATRRRLLEAGFWLTTRSAPPSPTSGEGRVDG